MVRKKRLSGRSPEKRPVIRLRDKLFGDLTELSAEELDLLYHSVAPEEEAAVAVHALAAQSADRYRKRHKPAPEHVKASLQSRGALITIEQTHPPALRAIVEGLGGPSSEPPESMRRPDGKSRDVTAADRRGIKELTSELKADGEDGDPDHWYVSRAAQLAGLLLERFRISGKPDLEALCCLLGLRVREKAFDRFDGVLIRGEGARKGIIGINSSIQEIARKRFTIAHELGHFMIPYHRQVKTMCETGLMDSFSARLATPELEANEFASELLLPTRTLRQRFDLASPSLSQISQVAREFDASLSAATWRFLALTKQPCAMVWNRGGRALWYRTSDTLPFRLPLHDLPAQASVASRLLAGESVPGGMQEVDPHLWFEAAAAAHIATLFEESTLFPGYNAVFTLLWVARLQ
jgi:hypothetical protein